MSAGEWFEALLFALVLAGCLYACWALFWFIFDLFVSEATRIARREKAKLDKRGE